MLINTNMTIAYKCSSCGTFEFFDISLFNLLKKKEFILTCRCNRSRIVMIKESSRICRLSVPCISCGDEHVFALDMKKAYADNKDIDMLYCPGTGMKLCFIGNDDSVRKKVDSYEKELDELINMFGYDSYFKNTQVMFDALNIIHDIAEQGNLHCECGNSDIELLLLSDKILLRCKNCDGNKIVYAASNEDLKDSLFEHQVLILSR